MFNVDFAFISAVDYSHNEIKDTKLNAKMTHLTAKSYSLNYIEGTEFGDGKGSVVMSSAR